MGCISCSSRNGWDGHLPALAEVREAVHRDWSNARRLESNEKLFQSWLKHYTVTVENPARWTPRQEWRERNDLLAPSFCAILWRRCLSPALAHEVRPAYLELRQTGAGLYDALWKVPARGEDLRLGFYVEFPVGTSNRRPHPVHRWNAA